MVGRSQDRPWWLQEAVLCRPLRAQRAPVDVGSCSHSNVHPNPGCPARIASTEYSTQLSQPVIRVKHLQVVQTAMKPIAQPVLRHGG